MYKNITLYAILFTNKKIYMQNEASTHIYKCNYVTF